VYNISEAFNKYNLKDFNEEEMKSLKQWEEYYQGRYYCVGYYLKNDEILKKKLRDAHKKMEEKEL